MPWTGKVILVIATIAAIYLAISTLTRGSPGESVCEVPAIVEVLNGCGRAGIAEKVASYLRDSGFDVMYVGNADDFRYGETIVVDRVGDRDKARAVADALGRVPVVYQNAGTFFVEVTVVLGSDTATSYGL
jgi:hypothetical protein